MAFYELTANDLQTCSNMKYMNTDIFTIYWNLDEHMADIGNNYKYCVVIQSTVDSGVYDYFTDSGNNTKNNLYSFRSHDTTFIDYFADRQILVKVCATDSTSVSWQELRTHTLSLQGQSFMCYNPPWLWSNFQDKNVVNVSDAFQFEYSTSGNVEYCKIRLYEYNIQTNSKGQLLDTYTTTVARNTRITVPFTLQNYKNYCYTVEVKNGSYFGTTDVYPVVFFTGETQYYYNMTVDKVTTKLRRDYTQTLRIGAIYFDIENSNNESMDLYVGILKDGDTYSDMQYPTSYTNKKYLEPLQDSFTFDTTNTYYENNGTVYYVNMFGMTAGRYISNEDYIDILSNLTSVATPCYFDFSINEEIGIRTSSAYKYLMAKNGKYTLYTDFPLVANSLIDYVEFLVYHGEDLDFTSPKIYNDRSDTSNLRLSWDFEGFNSNYAYSLVVRFTTIYGNKIENYSGAFNDFVIRNFLNNIMIKDVEYINGENSYTYRVHMYSDYNDVATIGLVLSNATGANYISYQQRIDPKYPIDFTFNKSNTAFTHQNEPYYLQLGAVDNGSLGYVDFETIRLNAEKYVVYYVLPPSLSINIDEGDIISNSSYTFLVNYYGSEEPLDYAIFTLYDENGDVLRESPKIFNVNNPPLILYYTFDGFEDDTTYKVGVYAKSLHGDEVEIEPISFSVSYESTILKAPIIIKNKCNDGYIEVKSNIFTGKGESNPDPMIFMQDGLKYSAYAVSNNPVINYGSETSSWIYWGEHIDINTDFILKFWFTVGTINNNIIRLYNDEGEYVNIKFNRKGSAGDYVEVSNSQGLVANSNIVAHTNSTNEYFLWVKAVGNEWDVRLTELDSEETVFNLNDSNNNLHYNMTSDMHWYGESYENNYRIDNSAYNINNFTKVLVGNAICKTIEITNDINLPYSVLPDAWGEDTVMFCDFDRNLNCGNLKEELSNIDSIRIKRKDETNNTWITLYEEDVTVGEDLNIYHRDYGVPKGIEQTYALVPVLPNGDEGEYVIDTVTPNWNGVFISDGEKCFKLYSSVSYGSVPRNTPVGVLNPIGSQYPIVITNSTNDYRSGMLSGMLLGYNYERTRMIDRVDIVKQTNDYIDFLKNGKTKFITDWNGNCWVVRLTDSPTIDFNVANTNGISIVKFSWVEQGKYNNEEDLKRNNLI